MTDPPQHLAVFVDLENLDRPQSLNFAALLEHLRHRGRVTVYRAYADWAQTPDIRRTLTAAGLELVDMAALNGWGKNATDIRIAVDAIELALTQPKLSRYVIVSGDSDFVPLIVRLRSYQKHVTVIADGQQAGRGAKSFCDAFEDFRDISGFLSAADPPAPPKKKASPSNKQTTATELVAEIVGDLQSRGANATLGELRAEWQRRSSKPTAAADLKKVVQEALATGLIETQSQTNAIRFKRIPQEKRKTAAMVHKMLTESAYRLVQRAVLHLTSRETATNWGQIKVLVQRISPNFHEARLGHSRFSELICAAHDAGYIEAQIDNAYSTVELPKPAETIARECAEWHLRRAIPRDAWGAASTLLSIRGIILPPFETHRALLRSMHDALHNVADGLTHSQLLATVRESLFEGSKLAAEPKVIAETMHGLLQLDMLIAPQNMQLQLPQPFTNFATWKRPLDHLIAASIRTLDIALTEADWESLDCAPSIIEQSGHDRCPQRPRQRQLNFD